MPRPGPQRRGTESQAELAQARGRLLFVDPPGRRVLCEAFGSAEIAEASEQAEEPIALLALSYVPPEDLRHLLIETLRSSLAEA